MLHFLGCFGFWIFIFTLIINKVIKGMIEGFNYVKKMHQIPCANCVYFTGNYCLKCTLHPAEAMSENAIACRDFELKSDYTTNYL